jgi:NADH-quinone oxidoreductase subunit N
MIYVLTTLGGFSVLIFINLERGLIGELSGLSRVYPVLALTWSAALLSTAGVPPLAGFLGKWLILLSGVGKEYYMACIVAVLGSVVSGYYYMRVVQTLYFPAYSYTILMRAIKRVERPSYGRSVILGVAVYSLLLIMVCPGWMLYIANQMVMGCYL